MGCGASSAAVAVSDDQAKGNQRTHRQILRAKGKKSQEIFLDDTSGAISPPNMLKLRSTSSVRSRDAKENGLLPIDATNPRHFVTIRSYSERNLFANAQPTLLAPPTWKNTGKTVHSPNVAKGNPPSPNRQLRGGSVTPSGSSRPSSATVSRFNLVPSPSAASSGTLSLSSSAVQNGILTLSKSRPSTATIALGQNGIIVPVTHYVSRPSSSRSERPGTANSRGSFNQSGVGPGGLSRPPSAQAVAASAAACAVAIAAAVSAPILTSPLPETKHLQLPRNVQILFDSVFRTVRSFRPKDPHEDLIFFAGEITQCLLGLDPPLLDDESQIYDVVGEVLLRIVVETVREAEEFPRRLIQYCQESVPPVDLPLAILEALRNPIDWLEITIK